MQPHRFSEEASVGRIARAVVLTLLATAALTMGYVILLRDSPLFYRWSLGVLLYGSFLGKVVEKIVHWTGLRGSKVANFLALVSLGVGNLLVYRLWTQQTGPNFENLGAVLLVAYLFFYNFRWQKYGYCDGCERWLQPTAHYGPYRCNQGVMTQLEMQERLDLSIFESVSSKKWRFLEVTLASCPGCQRCSTVRVLKVERHPLGVGRQVLGLLSVPSAKPASDIGPSLSSD